MLNDREMVKMEKELNLVPPPLPKMFPYSSLRHATMYLEARTQSTRNSSAWSRYLYASKCSTLKPLVKESISCSNYKYTQAAKIVKLPKRSLYRLSTSGMFSFVVWTLFTPSCSVNLFHFTFLRFFVPFPRYFAFACIVHMVQYIRFVVRSHVGCKRKRKTHTHTHTHRHIRKQCVIMVHRHE